MIDQDKQRRDRIRKFIADRWDDKGESGFLNYVEFLLDFEKFLDQCAAERMRA